MGSRRTSFESSTPNTSVGCSRAFTPESESEHCIRCFGNCATSCLQTRVKNICCVGAGYVRGPTSAVIAFQNPDIRVTVMDLDEARMKKWNSKHLPVAEPGLIDFVRVSRENSTPNPNLFFSTNVSECVAVADVVLVSVNTPTKLSGIGAGAATNLVALESAMISVAKAAKSGAIIVEKSTVPCGTARTIREILTLYRPGVPFEILSNPEFLAEGTATDYGSSQSSSGLAAATALEKVYAKWVEPSRIVTVNLWSSELSKLVANAMLAQRISSINAVSAICDQTGADIDEISKAVGLDQRLGGKFLKAGLGFGGSCFKKDILSLVYLSRSLHLPEVADYWMSVLAINDFQRDRFVNKVVSKLHNALMGKKIAILGYIFKQDTNDSRESPAIEVIKTLLAERPAEIAIFDPGCNVAEVRQNIGRHVAPSEAKPPKPLGPVEAAVLILTPWDQFRYPALAKQHSVFRKYSSDGGVEDLKVFQKPELSETDIVALGEFKPSSTMSLTEMTSSDPLNRLHEQACPNGCVYCDSTQHKNGEIGSENVDWALIAANMREPRWVIDGRNIVDVKQMELLGFRVESMGKAGTRYRQRRS
ncbi:nucleotide sugar dehydrogenase [Lophium mytilinum]|uniref:UDP-glucose 6-dehydrogenase n=1 Tax=Lophium mytilinum TaxID=390894 RepID=A0A6A6R1L8_9PEZI|nr:nucleotide sugar dehydrogenase [Lophium mytilinum]